MTNKSVYLMAFYWKGQDCTFRVTYWNVSVDLAGGGGNKALSS